MYRTLGVVVLILALVAAVLLVAGCPGKQKTDMTGPPGNMSGMMMKGNMTPPTPAVTPPGETKKGEAPAPGETKKGEAPPPMKGEKAPAGPTKMPPPPPPAPK